ncbi:MAG TPA: response regulator [Candidatus Acidoferrales bacterium]|nr:response regulator [Candidatus Acidoferrales bacterium]
MENIRRATLEMHTLLLCADAQFLGITRHVLNQLQVMPEVVSSSEAALNMIHQQEFDVVIVDWREIDNVADFLRAVRRSKLNPDCVLVAIVRDLLDLRQAFAAGAQFLIHKPASAVQIERCLRAAYCATVARRRKQHRERVEILAAITTRAQAVGEAMIINLSEGGAGLKTSIPNFISGASVSSGEDVRLRFSLPESDEMLDLTATVVWKTADACGVRFRYISEPNRTLLEQWLTDCVERSLAETCERVRAACA